MGLRSQFFLQAFATTEDAEGFGPIPHLNVKAHQVLVGSFLEAFGLNHLVRVLKGERLLGMDGTDREKTLADSEVNGKVAFFSISREGFRKIPRSGGA